MLQVSDLRRIRCGGVAATNGATDSSEVLKLRKRKWALSMYMMKTLWRIAEIGLWWQTPLDKGRSDPDGAKSTWASASTPLSWIFNSICQLSYRWIIRKVYKNNAEQRKWLKCFRKNLHLCKGGTNSGHSVTIPHLVNDLRHQFVIVTIVIIALWYKVLITQSLTKRFDNYLDRELVFANQLAGVGPVRVQLGHTFTSDKRQSSKWCLIVNDENTV